MNRASRFVLITLAFVSTLAIADDRADYNKRSAERYVAMFDMAHLASALATNGALAPIATAALSNL